MDAMEGVEAIALERAQQGDQEAFRVLVDSYSRQMFRVAFRMTGNQHDAEDVVQEAFLRAFAQLDKYESRAHFASWLHRIAANYAIDLLRRRKRWKTNDLDDPEQTLTLVAADAGPERSAQGGEIADRIADEIERLTPKERVAFVLRHYEGLSIQEIAEISGAGISATKNHIFRAVRKMRRALQPIVNPQGAQPTRGET